MQYHPRKANVVADALTRKTQHGLNKMLSTQPNILRDLENIGIELVLLGFTEGLLLALELQPSIIEEIGVSQVDDAKLETFRQNVG